MPRTHLRNRYEAARRATTAICEPLVTEDFVVQSMPDVSPPKWHLAHTTWFFETFALGAFTPDYRPVEPHYNFLFNSYYETIGPRWQRPQRGLLTRPTVADVRAYRAAVDARMGDIFAAVPDEKWPEFAGIVEIGIQHEQQHQELLVTDLKHILGINPLFPLYRESPPSPENQAAPPLEFVPIAGGMTSIGHTGDGFCFDNEGPRHDTFVGDFRLASRLVTNAEFLAFIDAGGYRTATLWLADGWEWVQREGWDAPLYWLPPEPDASGDADGRGRWRHFTLGGLRDVAPHEPVTHISYYEADAFARWAGFRLPTEFEWEHAARKLGVAPDAGNFADAGYFHPRPVDETRASPVQQMFGDAWEWTASAYLPYPGYRAAPGAIGEYNGKFMVNQMVLRGGSCATPQNHIRATYRNFFHPDKRWQFTGIRLAADA